MDCADKAQLNPLAPPLDASLSIAHQSPGHVAGLGIRGINIPAVPFDLVIAVVKVEPAQSEIYPEGRSKGLINFQSLGLHSKLRLWKF